MQEPSDAASVSDAAAPAAEPKPATPVTYGAFVNREQPNDLRPELRPKDEIAPKKPTPAPISMATPSDENNLMELLRIRHDESGFGDFDEIKVRFVVRNLTQRVGGVCGVIRGTKLIEASIGLILDWPWWSSTPVLRDLFCLVAPRYRKSFHQRAMLALAKDYATKLGVTLLMDAVGGVDIKQTDFGLAGLYRRNLGQAHAAAFVMRAPEDAAP